MPKSCPPALNTIHLYMLQTKGYPLYVMLSYFI